MGALNVALSARLFRVLADHEGYRRDDTAERFDRTADAMAYGLGEIEATLVVAADDLDRHCGYAVRLIRKRADAGVVDLLGALSSDRLAAVAFALPEKRRRVIVGRDPFWRRAVATVDPDAFREADQSIDAFNAYGRRQDAAIRANLPAADAERLERLIDGDRRLAAGLPHGLSLEELVRLPELHGSSLEELLDHYGDRPRLAPVA